jgi:hypothetical protein
MILAKTEDRFQDTLLRSRENVQKALTLLDAALITGSDAEMCLTLVSSSKSELDRAREELQRIISGNRTNEAPAHRTSAFTPIDAVIASSECSTRLSNCLKNLVDTSLILKGRREGELWHLFKPLFPLLREFDALIVLNDIGQFSKSELRRVPKLGEKALEELMAYLEKHDVKLRGE